jgi:hypothetical protein
MNGNTALIVVPRVLSGTSRSGRVVTRTGATTVNGVAALTVAEAAVTGTLAAGAYPEGVLFEGGKDESHTVAGTRGRALPVVKWGLIKMIASGALNATNAAHRLLSWDAEGRVRAGTWGTDIILGELCSSCSNAGDEVLVFINTQRSGA